MSLFLRTIRHGWTSGSLRRSEASAISPTRAMMHVGRSMQTSRVSFIPNTSSWPPTWTTWRRTPSGTGDLLHQACWGQGLSQGTFCIKLWERRIFPQGLFVVETERSQSDGELLSRGYKSGKNPTDIFARCTATSSRQVEMRTTETH